LNKLGRVNEETVYGVSTKHLFEGIEKPLQQVAANA